MRRAGGLRPALLALLALAAGARPSAQAQDVVELLQRQRLASRMAEVVAEIGEATLARPLVTLPGATLPYFDQYEGVMALRRAVADSVARAQADSLARTVRLPPLVWRRTPAEAQGDFLDRYRETFWTAAAVPHALDTVATPELRARLGALFGAPTRNAAAAEQEGYAGSEYVQFEYWLVANDSIPILVLDTDGPFGRGLLIAGDERYRRLIPALKADLAARVLAAGPPTPYADYYHSHDRRQWYRAGFDGQAYFAMPVRTPRWALAPRRDQRWRIYR